MSKYSLATLTVLMSLLLFSGTGFSQSQQATNALQSLNSSTSSYASFSLGSDGCRLNIAYKADTHLRGSMELKKVNNFAVIAGSSSSKRKVRTTCKDTSDKCVRTTFHGNSNYSNSWTSNDLSPAQASNARAKLNELITICKRPKLQRHMIRKGVRPVRRVPIRSRKIKPVKRPTSKRPVKKKK